MARAPRTPKAAEAAEVVAPVITEGAPNTETSPTEKIVEGKEGTPSDVIGIVALGDLGLGAVFPPLGGGTGETRVTPPETGTAMELIAAAQTARAAPPEPDEPEIHVYPVRSPLRHNRRRYSPDDPRANTIPLTEAEAETLVALGVLGEP